MIQERRKYSAEERCNRSKIPEKMRGDRVQSRVQRPARCTLSLLRWEKQRSTHALADRSHQTSELWPIRKKEHRRGWGDMTQISGSWVGSTQVIQREIAAASTTDRMIRSGKALGDISVWERFSQCRWERHHYPMNYKVRRNNTGLRKVTAAGAAVKTWDDPGNCKGRAHPEGISQKNSKS